MTGARTARALAFAAASFAPPGAHAVEPEAHGVYVERLRRTEQQTYADIVALYDQHLQSSPGDVRAAIERCRFMATALYDPVEEANPKQDDFDACLSSLESSHPNAPDVVLYQLEQRWGDDALEYGNGVLDAGIEWSPADRARLFAALAWHAHRAPQVEQAARFAQQALEAGSSEDFSLLFAAEWQRQGHRDEAIRQLGVRLEAGTESWILHEKVRRLEELGAWHEAALACDAVAEQPDHAYRSLRCGRAYRLAGRADLAREVLLEARERSWEKEEASFELFLLDIDHFPTEAYASYQAYRDLSYLSDPVLRHRLSLAVAQPSAPWRARDALGALTFVALVLVLALLPLVWLLPVHYRGLLAKVRGVAREASSRWRLRHAWYGCAMVLLAQAVAVYASLLAVPSFLSAETQIALPESEIARCAALAIGLTALGCIPLAWYLGPRSWLGRWPSPWILFEIAIGAVALRALAIGVSALVNAPPAAAGLGIVVVDDYPTQQQFIAALHREYGVFAVITAVALLAPLCEELVFRGALFGGMQRYITRGAANGIQAVIFGIFHGEPMMLPFLIASGLWFGRLARVTGGLLAPTGLHVLVNLTAVGAWLALARA